MRSGLVFFVTFCALGCNNGNLKTPDGGQLDMGIPGSDLAMPLPTATMVAPAVTMTSCLAIDATRLYWSDFTNNTAAIVSVPLAGGTPSQVAPGGDKYTCVATDGTSVFYFAGSGATLMKAPAGGGSAVSIANNQHLLGDHVVVGGGNVYWLTDTYGNLDMFNGNNAVVRISATTGASAADVTPFSASVSTNPRGLAIDDTNVYYSDRMGSWLVPLANAAGLERFDNVSVPSQLAAGAGRVALAESGGVIGDGGGGGTIVVYGSNGSGRQVVAMTVGTPLAVDDKGVYVALDGQLARLALDGSGPTYLTAHAPHAVALSADKVYFTDGATLWSVPR